MKYSYSFVGLLTVALSSSAAADDCSDACSSQHDSCLGAPDANRASCASDYASCLGYNPYVDTGFVAPTACSHTTDLPTGTRAADVCIQVCDDNHSACMTGAGAVLTVCDVEHTSCRSVCSGTITTTTMPIHTGDGDACVQACSSKHDDCLAAPDANHASCSANYAECLGYNPYENDVFAAPTACSHTPTAPVTHQTDSPEACCQICTTYHKECCGLEGAVIADCDSQYTVCLGYNPFEVVPWTEPSACAHGVPMPKPPKHHSSGSYSSSSSSSSSSSKNHTAEECCVSCTTRHKECCAADGAIISNCDTEYTVCLGYSPFDITPWVEPTVCKGDHYTTDSHTNTDNHGKTDFHGTAEECCVSCTHEYTVCCDAPGSVIETCKTVYVDCLGYNPFDVIPWVEPTACKGGDFIISGPPTMNGDNTKTHTTGKTVTAEECCLSCTQEYTICCDAPEAVLETCKTSYSGCLGYNPFGITPWAEPTVCKGGDYIISAPLTQTGGNHGKTGDETKTHSPGKTGEAEDCCAACTKAYDVCCSAADAVITTCEADYSSCLGYNPFEAITWVEPTVCVYDGYTGDHYGEDVVLVSGGECLQPALVLLAIGAIALLC
ncbi:hypothetical protein FZEAL_5378 [Fusarium zealandicum]|uniref:Uncharacterized protein n=1 Tax=Fusarium zealandicum TaxID=1053134 RepID=A0A8H4XKX6_9HYPO|nr:hypothetical protein FZEAL_5378 [Fusarium zealandicum]